MSDNNVVCPDCKSTDVQKIEKKKLVIEEEEGGCSKIIKTVFSKANVVAGVVWFVLVSIGGGLMETNQIAGVIVVVVSFVAGGVLYFKLRKPPAGKDKESGTYTTTFSYYVCRSCGREFRVDSPVA